MVCSTRAMSTRRSPSTIGAAATLSSSRFSADARVAVRVHRDRVDGLVVDRHRLAGRDRGPTSEQRAVQDARDFVRRQPAEHEHLRTGEQRRVDLERRVLGGRADQHDVARLDPRQERVLLRLVEAVDLVDEHDRPAAGGPPDALGLGHHVADFLDARQHRAERDEPRLGRVGDDAGERRLARARRAPQDDRLEQIALDRFPQRLARREQLLLPDELVEGPRPHALGERRPRRRGGRGVFGEQGIHIE